MKAARIMPSPRIGFTLSKSRWLYVEPYSPLALKGPPSMAIIGIVAVDRNLAIGKGGRLPWHYSADMKFFKETTIGNAVVMGRHTWLTLKGPLKDRQNLVLTRDPNFDPRDSVIAMRDVESVISHAKKQDQHLFVIGGEKVYQS